MRRRLPDPSTSPLPRIDDPAPLLPSPSSVLGLTASVRRRRKQMSRASSSEPTFASGLANWRRAPKKDNTGSGTGTTGSNEASGRKRGIRGAGMGMQGTPAKKGKRSDSKSMGAHSTPAATILSRTRSTSNAANYGGVSVVSSLSSLGSSFPSSADVRTPSPGSLIPGLSSPSIPAIYATHGRRDVFDAGYVPSPKLRTSEEIEECERLVEDAQNDSQEEPPEQSAMIDEQDVAALYGWKEDVLWSLRGSTATGSPADQAEGSNAEEEIDAPTIRQDTVYHDVVVSMNDNSISSSPSSRTKARSSTIKNRHPIPHKPSSEVHNGLLSIYSSHTSIADSNSDLASVGSGPLRASTNAPLSRPHLLFEGSTLSLSTDHVDPSVDQALILTQLDLSDPHQLRASGSDLPPPKFSEPVSGKARDILPGPSLTSLPATHPTTPAGYVRPVSPSQPVLISPHLVESEHHQAHNDSMEIGRAGFETPPDFGGGPDSDPDFGGLPPYQDLNDMFGGDDEIDFGDDLDGDRSDDFEPLLVPLAREEAVVDYSTWSPIKLSDVPVRYTPSSHLSPRSPPPSMSPISFATTRSPSIDLRISPPPPRKDMLRKRNRPQPTRKGAWRGAAVLARMEESDRDTARYHVTYDVDPISAGGELRKCRPSGKGRKRVSEVKKSVFEETEEVLEARQKRIEHYKDLEHGYRLHVELVL